MSAAKIGIMSTGHAVGKREQDAEEWAVEDLVTTPEHVVGSGPQEGQAWVGIGRGDGSRPWIWKLESCPALLRKSEEASVAGVVVGWVLSRFMGIKD